MPESDEKKDIVQIDPIDIRVAELMEAQYGYEPTEATLQNVRKIARFAALYPDRIARARSPFSTPSTIVLKKSGDVVLEPISPDVVTVSEMLFAISKHLTRFSTTVSNEHIENKLDIALKEAERYMSADPLFLEEVRAEVRYKYLNIQIPPRDTNYFFPPSVIIKCFTTEYIEELMTLYLSQANSTFTSSRGHCDNTSQKDNFSPVRDFYQMISGDGANKDYGGTSLMRPSVFFSVGLAMRQATTRAALFGCDLVNECIPTKLKKVLWLGDSQPYSTNVRDQMTPMVAGGGFSRHLLKNHYNALIYFLEKGEGFSHLIKSQHQLFCALVVNASSLYQSAGETIAQLECLGLETQRVIDRETARFIQHRENDAPF